jgi:hypothetical protein
MYGGLPGKTKFSKNTTVSLLHFNLTGQSLYSEPMDYSEKGIKLMSGFLNLKTIEA